MSIEESATKFARKYANQFEQATRESWTVSAAAKAMISHYTPVFTSFVAGERHVTSYEELLAGSEGYLQSFKEHGLGFDLRLKDLRVETISPMAAFCWMTWEIFPEDGSQGWHWQNCYGFRKTDQLEGFEYVNADQELMALAQHRPKIIAEFQARRADMENKK